MRREFKARPDIEKQRLSEMFGEENYGMKRKAVNKTLTAQDTALELPTDEPIFLSTEDTGLIENMMTPLTEDGKPIDFDDTDETPVTDTIEEETEDECPVEEAVEDFKAGVSEETDELMEDIERILR